MGVIFLLNNSDYVRWGLIALFIYNLLLMAGIVIDFLGSTILIDADLTSIIANIFTTTHGFFAGLFGYGDIFKYSRVYFLPYVIGGLVWVILGLFLYHISFTRLTTYCKFTYLSKLLGLSGVLAFLISMCVTLLFYIFTQDPFSIILIIFLAVIYVPLLVVGLYFKLSASFFCKDKQAE